MAEHKVNLKIPTDWNDITISMYQKFTKIDQKKLNEEQLNVKLISVMCGIKEGMLQYMDMKDLKSVSKYLMVLVNKKPDLKTLVKKVEWNGKKYGLIPNMSEITLGEYVDIETYCKDSNKDLHKIMSVMYRPIIKETKSRYSIEEYKPDDFKTDEYLTFPMLPAISSLHFFFLLGTRLPHDLNRFSSLKAQKEILKIKKGISQRSGVGTT